MKLRRELKMMRREFSNGRKEFLKINKVIKNLSDYLTEVMMLKREVKTTGDEIEMIMENMPSIFSFKEKEQTSKMTQKELDRITTNINRRNTRKRMLQSIPRRS